MLPYTPTPPLTPNNEVFFWKVPGELKIHISAEVLKAGLKGKENS